MIPLELRQANGPAVIQTLKSKVKGLIPYNPGGDKVSRAHAISPQVQSGNVVLPHPDAVTWDVNGLVERFALFPFVENDDEIDALTQVLLYLEQNNVTIMGANDFLRRNQGRI